MDRPSDTTPLRALPAWAVQDLTSPLLSWRGEMERSTAFTSPCGCGGLRIWPFAQRDSWARTFYEPLLNKDDAAAFLATVPADAECTIDGSFSILCNCQFDQVGLFVSAGDGCFVKAGLEYADGAVKLSVVVTNGGFSDWSTQPWPHTGKNASVRLRLHKLVKRQGACIVVEVSLNDDGSPCPHSPQRSQIEWTFIRIAPMHSNGSQWRVGCFAASPVAAGAVAEWRHLRVGPLENVTHAADAGAML